MPMNNPSAGLSLSRAVSYENINLSQRRQPAFMSPSSSTNSLHRSGSSASLNGANSQTIASGAMHREAASMLNVNRAGTVRQRLIPKFIRKYNEQIKTAGAVLEKSGIAVAAVGGAMVIIDGISSDDQITQKNKNVKENSENITFDAISTVEPMANAIVTTAAASPITSTTTTTTTTERPRIHNPIGRNK